MSDRYDQSMFEKRLLQVLTDLERQNDAGSTYSRQELSFQEEMANIREYISVAGEYALAYECLVSTIERISGNFLVGARTHVQI